MRWVWFMVTLAAMLAVLPLLVGLLYLAVRSEWWTYVLMIPGVLVLLFIAWLTKYAAIRFDHSRGL